MYECFQVVLLFSAREIVLSEWQTKEAAIDDMEKRNHSLLEDEKIIVRSRNRRF